jgi:hypothetical protein
VLSPEVRFALELGFRLIPVYPPRHPIYSNVPRDKRGKHPIGANWQKRASNHPAKIEAEMAQHPDCNLGALNGYGHFALDIDGPEGESILSKLQDQWGLLPQTLTSLSGREGGRRLHFRIPTGIRIRTGKAKWGRGLDIPLQVLIPPSIHGNGKQYRWEDLSVPIAALPACWVEALKDISLEESPQRLPNSRACREMIPISEVMRLLAIEPGAGGMWRCWRTENHNHGDRTPSMSIVPGHNRVKCFVCDRRSLSTVQLVMDHEGLDCTDAFKMAGGKVLRSGPTYGQPQCRIESAQSGMERGRQGSSDPAQIRLPKLYFSLKTPSVDQWGEEHYSASTRHREMDARYQADSWPLD